MNLGLFAQQNRQNSAKLRGVATAPVTRWQGRLSGQQIVVSEQAPKVEALARIAEASGSMCLTDAAKHLGVQRCRLIEWMHENRWIYRREGSMRLLAYQPRMLAGLLDHKVFLDLHVKVAKDWQRDPKQLQRLGF